MGRLTLPLLAATLAIAACNPAPNTGPRPVAGAVATPTPDAAALEASPSATATPTPTATPSIPVIVVPTPTPTPSVAPLAMRSLADRPDDSTDFQLHVVYLVPADAEDRHFDTDGTIARSLAAANHWFTAQTNGSRLRLDTFQGQPDITFRRDPRTTAELQADPELVEKLGEAAPEAGDARLNKTYVYYFDIDSASSKEVSGGKLETLGKGGGGRAVLFLRSCSDCSLASDATKAGPYEFTVVHEVLHALHFVAACAPNATSDHHTTDSPSDLMAAIEGDDTPTLDPGHDDYYATGRKDCADLATSPFLDPPPAGAVAPEGRPLVLAPGAGAMTLAPGLTVQAAPGNATVEGLLLDRLNDLRRAKGQRDVIQDPALLAAARRLGLEAIAGTPSDANTVLAAAGFAGPFGFAAAGFQPVLDPTAAATAALTALGTPPWLGDAEVGRVGVGVAERDNQVIATVAYTTSQLVIDKLAIAPGPQDTYTLGFTMHPRDATTIARVRVLVDDVADVFPTPVKAGEPVMMTASVPRKGKHRVRLAVGRPGDETFAVDQSFEVDGTAPLERAVTLQGN